MVERQLPKLKVAGSRPVSRSIFIPHHEAIRSNISITYPAQRSFTIRSIFGLTHTACGHIWGGRKQEQKIDRKAALVAYDRLKSPNAEILWNLFRFQTMSQQQVGDCFFDAASPKKRSELAGYHLGHLSRVGLVEPVPPTAQHHYKAFFTPSHSGMFIGQTLEQGDARKIKRVKESKAHKLLSSIHANHHLFVADSLAGFVKAEYRGEGQLTYWGDREGNYVFGYLGSRQRIQPDATCIWSTEERAYKFWVEVENRLGSLDEMVEKIKKYIFFSVAGDRRGDVFRRSLGVNQFPVLLVVAARKNQLPSLRQAIINGVLRGCPRPIPETAKKVVIALAALDDIREVGVLGPVWEAPLQATGRLHRLTDLYNQSLLSSRP